jgi:hypothetical protein
VISLVGINASNGVSVSSPQGFTTRADPIELDPLPGRSLGLADRFVAAPGSVTSPSWSESSPSQWAYVTVAFR